MSDTGDEVARMARIFGAAGEAMNKLKRAITYDDVSEVDWDDDLKALLEEDEPEG
jgi:hypothetical protein